MPLARNWVCGREAGDEGSRTISTRNDVPAAVHVKALSCSLKPVARLTRCTGMPERVLNAGWGMCADIQLRRCVRMYVCMCVHVCMC